MRPADRPENIRRLPRIWRSMLAALMAIPFTACGAATESGAAPGGGSGPPQFLPIAAQWCLEASAASGRPQGPPCIQLEVPRGERQFSLGLQLRPPLAPLQGMWFSFSPPTPARFWMHRTPASLDMVFVRDGRVSFIEAKVPPCPSLPCTTYGTGSEVDGVVELAAGQASALGIVVGTPVRILPITSAVPARPARD